MTAPRLSKTLYVRIPTGVLNVPRESGVSEDTVEERVAEQEKPDLSFAIFIIVSNAVKAIVEKRFIPRLPAA
jgi:hypothetical protein